MQDTFHARQQSLVQLVKNELKAVEKLEKKMEQVVKMFTAQSIN